MAYVYIVRCEDETLYTGIANDINKRLREHYDKSKNCAKYTKSHCIKALEMLWMVEKYSDAAKLEYRIKHLPRSKKLLLISKPDSVYELFPELCGIEYNPLCGVTLADCLNGL